MSTLCLENQTNVKDIILLGFQGKQGRNIPLASLFMIIYLSINIGNGLIVITVCLQQNLQKPMYYLLAHFSGLEICYTAVFMPWIIVSLMTGIQMMPLTRCMIQLYFYISFGVSELLLLAVMAVDRHQAICNPLHYTQVMNKKICTCLSLGSWIGGFLFSLPPILLLQHLEFTGTNVINNFLCDGPAILQLSCTDTRLHDLMSFVLSIVTMMTSFLFTFCSYISVIHTILKLPKNTKKSKTFSTCSSHLTAAAIYYGSLIFMYARPQSIKTYDVHKTISTFYTIILPIINPLIYSLRNKEFKDAVKRLFQ
uniref:Olfactory receptor n=1 Tax=Pyxicephalus adspersus TaxID=30357 RepID=A0AAV2ZWH4_PYXAD|nr:TPA: hypothetical protein GDO54_013892 [Pyxicephalus adspersus]